MRIVVIEDNQANLDLTLYLLRSFGHTAYAASDGVEGVEVAIREKPDLVICDIHMPRLDGHGVLAKLRGDPSMSSVPIVAVTALAMVGDADRVLKTGFDGYISKPIEPETFVQQIETLLSRIQRRRLQTES